MSTAPPPVARSAPPGLQRPPLVRLRDERVLAGVCAGVAQHLGLPLSAVRVTTTLLSLFGPGLVVYGFLWLTMPSGVADNHALTARPLPRAVMLVLIVAGVIAAISMVGVGVRSAPSQVLPTLAVIAGLLVAWSILDRSRRQQLFASPSKRESLLRIGIGAILVFGGLSFVASQGRGLAGLRDLVLATVIVLVGAVLLLAPFALGLVERFRQEQTERIRATEKADIAAHLHDSVLQTLALIQRKADDPVAVQRLARGQERELRQWLFTEPGDAVTSLAGLVREAAEELEDQHGVPVDLVVTGDRSVGDDDRALSAALREALSNAVRHGAPPISVYVEIGPESVEAFVRDHGSGFDLDDVAEDRLGVRESVIGRMRRHGGSASVNRRPDGTEVVLRLPQPTHQQEA